MSDNKNIYKIKELNNDINNVKFQMAIKIQDVLDKDERLEEIDLKAQNLDKSSKDFKKITKKNNLKMNFKNRNIKIILAAVIIFILFIIILVIFLTVKINN